MPHLRWQTTWGQMQNANAVAVEVESSDIIDNVEAKIQGKNTLGSTTSHLRWQAARGRPHPF